MSDVPEVRLRVLTLDDVDWVVDCDAETATPLAEAMGLERTVLATQLEDGAWASSDQWGWAVMVDGNPAGFVIVTGLDSGDARTQIRLRSSQRGRGVGREVLRQLGDHHFADNDGLQRLVGLAHERNLPMQRAFNAAGFRMEARYRDSTDDPDGGRAAVWGYALTRRDWQVGRHHLDDAGYDVHGLVFRVDEVLEGPLTGSHGLVFTLWQDGRRVTGTFESHEVADGELAGLLVADVVRYHYLQDFHRVDDGELNTGTGRMRIQRVADGRLQLVNDWSDREGRHGRTLLLQERRNGSSPVAATTGPPSQTATD